MLIKVKSKYKLFHKSFQVPKPSVATPVLTSVLGSTTGGTLAAGTYYYIITFLANNGETLKSNEISVVNTGTTSSNVLNWTLAQYATGVRVYRGTAAGLENIYYALGAVTTFTDTGAAGTAGTAPAVNNTGNGILSTDPVALLPSNLGLVGTGNYDFVNGAGCFMTPVINQPIVLLRLTRGLVNGTDFYTDPVTGERCQGDAWYDLKATDIFSFDTGNNYGSIRQFQGKLMQHMGSYNAGNNSLGILDGMNNVDWDDYMIQCNRIHFNGYVNAIYGASISYIAKI